MRLSITSITQGPRQSNFELLRIIAMLMVLIVHADFLAVKAPKMADFETMPINSVSRTLFESFAIVSVNVFVLISGWFGIRPKVAGFSKFIFQCLYFTFGIYAVVCIGGYAELSVSGIMECLFYTPQYWFVTTYTLLYLLAPVLNSFIEQSPRNTLRNVVIAFFIFQSLYGWYDWDSPFKCGYSTISFIGLYLLARYFRLYKPKMSHCGLIFVLTTIVSAILYYCHIRFSLYFIEPFAYNSPIVVLQSLSLLLWFSRIRIATSKFINWISASCFAVYLFHINPHLFQLYLGYIRDCYQNASGLQCLGLMTGVIFATFALSILLDQPRKWLWSAVSLLWFKKK